MVFDPLTESDDLTVQFWQRGFVTLSKLADATREVLRDAVEFAADTGGEMREPFVIDDERLDLVPC